MLCQENSMSPKVIAGLLAGIAATAALAQPAPPPPGQPGQPGGPGMQRAETRAEVVQRTQALFARLDRNRDGAITQDELPAMGDRADRGPAGPGGPAEQRAPGASRERGDEMFARMDLNHDGVISRAEFDQAHAQ